jgi:hypothetical protein
MMKLTATLHSPRPISVVEKISSIRGFAAPPVKLEVDGTTHAGTADWVKDLCRAKFDGCAYWENRRKQVELLPRSELAVFSLPEGFANVDDALAILEPLPFEICALGAVFFDEWIKADYPRWGFGRSHIEHGWGCAFRGAGHDRLVSRRWLDFGPWRVIRRPNDTTFIQFHDLTITDPAEAYEQAKVGHERMGNSKIGGHLQHMLSVFLGHTAGLYIESSKTLEIVVPPKTEVGQMQMHWACAERLHHRLTRPAHQPIERVAFVFFDEADARAHLHELWLRELECWHVDGSGKHRLDLDYHPTPNPPEWVKRLEGRGV